MRASNKVATAVLLSAFDSVQQGDIARQVTMRRDGGEELDRVNMKGGPSSADDDEIGGDGGGGGDDQLPLEDDLEKEIDSGDEF